MEMLFLYLAYAYFIGFGVMAGFRSTLIMIAGLFGARVSLPSVIGLIFHVIWWLSIGYIVYSYNVGSVS